MKGVLTFGEALGLVATSDIGTLNFARQATIGIGGAEMNVAVGLARFGVPVTWIGRVGRDAVGDLIVHRLVAEGIDVHATVDTSFTGLMLRHRRTAMMTHVDYYRAGSAGSRLSPDDIPADAVERCAVVHITGITPALSQSAAAAVERGVELAGHSGAAVSLDVNYRRKLWDPDTARTTLMRLLPRVEVLFAGVEEAQLLLSSNVSEATVLAKQLAELGPREVIVKQGADGCTAYVDGQTHRRAAVPVPIIDPVGAGDAFVAGYLAERLAGAPIPSRLDTAVAAGAYAVSVPGDCELLPTRRELEDMLRGTDVVR